MLYWITHFFQTNTFVNRLSGPSIGFTAMGMFVVNKPMILTVRIQKSAMETYTQENNNKKLFLLYIHVYKKTTIIICLSLRENECSPMTCRNDMRSVVFRECTYYQFVPVVLTLSL